MVYFIFYFGQLNFFSSEFMFLRFIGAQRNFIGTNDSRNEPPYESIKWIVMICIPFLFDWVVIVLYCINLEENKLELNTYWIQVCKRKKMSLLLKSFSQSKHNKIRNTVELKKKKHFQNEENTRPITNELSYVKL